MLTLRDYQQDQFQAVLREFTDKRTTLLSAATGTGKTVLMCAVAKHFLQHGKGVCFIAHRDELVRKTAETMETMLGVPVGIEMGEDTVTDQGYLGPRLVSASIQSMHARLRRFDRERFGLLCFDEAHRSIARTYLKVEEHFNVSKVLGVTATPVRGDKRCLSGLYESVAHAYPISTAVNDGWLVMPKCRDRKIEGIDLSGVKVRGGDFQANELAAMMTGDGERLHAVAMDLLQHIGHDPCILFAATVDHAMHQARVLNEHRKGWAACIHGATPKQERRDILAAHAQGDIGIVTNCDVLTEGFDAPYVKHIAMCAPTKSEVRYVQQVGRVTRPLPGGVDGVATADGRREAIRDSAKHCGVIHRYVGSLGRHKLPDMVDLQFPDVADRVKLIAKEIIRDTTEPLSAEEAVEEAEKVVYERDAQAKRNAGSILDGAKVKGVEKWVSAFAAVGVDPFAASGQGDIWEKKVSLQPWQRTILKNAKYDPASMPPEAAVRLANLMHSRKERGLCSPKQVEFLKKQGVQGAEHLTAGDAGRLIGEYTSKFKRWRKR